MKYIKRIGLLEVLAVILLAFIIFMSIYRNDIVSFLHDRKNITVEDRNLSNVKNNVYKNIKKVNLTEISLEAIVAFSKDENCTTEERCKEYSKINNKLEEFEF